ncbi:MAG: twin-arginine translocase subunit TatC [Acidobacteriota bacterium]|jgi:sec-independent protein translocase protein TatC|nr:twin-arginine translocase subunit TatC [Acidobacteriota bacterium]
MTRSHPDKMTFLEHLEELRSRLVRIALYLAGGFGACWGFHEQIFGFLTQPLRRAGFSDQFIYTSPAEAFFLYMKMSFFVGIFVAFPFILWEIWAFISPGLYRHEKLWAIPFIGMGSFFFTAGAIFGHFALFPLTFKFLWGFAGPDMRFLPRIGEYWSFYSWFLLGIGAVFQIPVVIFVLARIGLVSARMLLKGWKWAILAAFVLAAIITPSADVVTQTALAGPMIGLYLLGVVIAWIFGRKRSGEEEDDEETVSEAARS